MPETVGQSSKRPYRVVQVEGKITWRIEELWEGGVVRQPYGSKESAIKFEEEMARKNGFIEALVLQEAVSRATMPSDAFRKDTSGNWECVQACALDMENKEIVFTKGTTFTKGSPFMGVDVAKWLDENIKA